MTRSNQGFDPHDLESIAIPEDAEFLGIDESGTHHYWSKDEQTVFTFVDEEAHEAIDHRRSHLDIYVSRIADEVGWAELDYDASPMETIGKHLAMIAREEGPEVA